MAAGKLFGRGRSSLIRSIGVVKAFNMTLLLLDDDRTDDAVDDRIHL